ncbi:Mad3/Bub1 homology region 1 [Dillenia turbinata]|uniref:Mad3/Bub1 homology region 1 n=1 Tax=Dillenia turbinata TaxID=194707 RepID=A0AAN8W050_9MAGN
MEEVARMDPETECIEWVQEAFPPPPSGEGDCSGLVVLYKQCVRSFWHSECYKDDLCYLKFWLEYLQFFCPISFLLYSKIL